MWGREGVAGSCHGLCVCIIEVIPAACSASHGAFIGGGTLVAVCWGLPCCSLCCYCIWAQLGCQPISLPPSPPASQPWRVARTQLLGSYMQQWCGKCSIMNCFGVPLVLDFMFCSSGTHAPVLQHPNEQLLMPSIHDYQMIACSMVLLTGSKQLQCLAMPLMSICCSKCCQHLHNGVVGALTFAGGHVH